jgi:hypothetical protein
MNERLMTMNVGCVAIPPLFTDYVAWGFMDDCLRVTNVAIAGDTSSVSSITTDKKVGPTFLPKAKTLTHRPISP